MSDWCPENDGAYRMEMAAMYPRADRRRIEELEAENKRLRLEVQHANDVADVAIEQAKELEAKLAKAVEALDNVVVEYDLFRKYEYERGLSSLDDEIEDARTTLAELEGEK